MSSDDRSRSSIKHGFSHACEARAKHTQKTFFRVLEQEQKLISRENMQLLGLTIQKIDYVPVPVLKGKKNVNAEICETVATTMQASELVSYENSENIPEAEGQNQQETDVL